MSSPLPPSVRALLERVHSHEELDLLLQLASAPPRSFGAKELAESAGLQPALAIESLERMARGGLLRTTGEGVDHRVYAVSDEHVEGVMLLARSYAAHLPEIIKLLSNNAMERLRTEVARAFADAFLLKGRK